MGLLNFFAKITRPWEVHLLKKDGSRESSGTQDRPGAIAGIILGITDPALKIERVMYAGKPVSRTGFEDLVADAHILNYFTEIAQKQGLPIATLIERGLNKAQSKAAYVEVARRTSKTLGVKEDQVFDLLMRRLSRGLAGIAKQQTP